MPRRKARTLTEVELEFLKEVRRKVPRLFFIFNKIDYLDTGEREEAIAFLRRVLSENAGVEDDLPVFAVSAKKGLAARAAEDAEAWKESGLEAVEEHLVDFLAREKAAADKAAREAKEAAEKEFAETRRKERIEARKRETREFVESLKKDKDTRQAFMHFNTPDHQWFGNKDQVCTLQALFHIRNDKLHMTLTMRSNDVIYGFMTDWAFFSLLHYHVFLHLKNYYPTLEMGSYTHVSHSMHLYKRHYELVEKMVAEPFYPAGITLPNKPIVDESGRPLEEYRDLLLEVEHGNNPEPNLYTKTNGLMTWIFEHITK